MEELIKTANDLGFSVALIQSTIDRWQCNLNAFCNRMYYVCNVSETPELALSTALKYLTVKMERDGPPSRLITHPKKIDLDDLLAGL